MKTKKIAMALVVAGLAVSFNSSAQGLYLGVGGGYGFGAAKMDMGSTHTSTVTSTGVSTDTYTAKNMSLGKGVNLGLYGGYMFTKNLGAELGLGYLIGGSSEFTDTKNGPNSSSTTTNTSKGSMMRLVPALRMQFGEDKLMPYATVGLIIGVAGKFTAESVSTQSATGIPSSTSDDITTYSGGISMGLHTSVGAVYKVSDMLGIFAELSANLQNYSPSKGILTKSTSNGKDNLPGMTTSQTETDYTSTYTVSSNAPSSPGTASQGTSMKIAYSSIGFNIGVHFTFGGK